ncbi:MAG: hypothetical protein HYZ37_10040 [Candidatus Solibacter usitatus]|nr:hypothetical protein [Candidatus Solibacter usitatus]
METINATSEQSSSAGTKYYVWDPPGKKVVVHISLDVVDKLLMEVMRGFGSVPRRGAEVGGILLGNSVPGEKITVHVDDYVPVVCEHKKGPSYLLSDADQKRFREAIDVHDYDGEKTVYAVGVFRSHTREGLSLEEADLKFWYDYLPELSSVFLLVKPYATRASIGGFFVREENGKVQKESTSLEFPFRRRDLIAAEPEEAAALPTPGNDPGEVPELLSSLGNSQEAAMGLETIQIDPPEPEDFSFVPVPPYVPPPVVAKPAEQDAIEADVIVDDVIEAKTEDNVEVKAEPAPAARRWSFSKHEETPHATVENGTGQDPVRQLVSANAESKPEKKTGFARFWKKAAPKTPKTPVAKATDDECFEDDDALPQTAAVAAEPEKVEPPPMPVVAAPPPQPTFANNFDDDDDFEDPVYRNIPSLTPPVPKLEVPAPAPKLEQPAPKLETPAPKLDPPAPKPEPPAPKLVFPPPPPQQAEPIPLVKAAAASAASAPTTAPAPRFDAEAEESEEQQPVRKTRRAGFWIPLSFIFVLLGVLLGFQAALSYKPAKAAGLLNDPYGLALSAGRSGDFIAVHWDRFSFPVRAAQRGVLTITEGTFERKVDLDVLQLQNPTVYYRNQSDAVRFRLDVYTKDKISVSETLDWRK